MAEHMPEHLEEIEYEGLSPNAGLGVCVFGRRTAKKQSSDTGDRTGQHGSRCAGESFRKIKDPEREQEAKRGMVAVGKNEVTQR